VTGDLLHKSERRVRLRRHAVEGKGFKRVPLGREQVGGGAAFRVRRRAISLVEALVSMILVSGLLVVSLDMCGAAVISSKGMFDQARARFLAQSLLAEVVASSFEEPPPGAPSFGTEVGEATGTRVNFDDVDDYDTWNASPPQGKDGTPLAGFTGWTRKVQVKYLRSDTLAVSFLATGIKRIVVTIEYDGGVVTTMTAVRTDASSFERILTPKGN